MPMGSAYPQYESEYHVKLKITGNKNKIRLFHWMLEDMDRDYPWKEDGTLKLTAKVCKDCGGTVYPRPKFRAEHILGWAKQLSEMDLLPGRVKVKIKRFCGLTQCQKMAKDGVEKELGKGKEN